MWVAVARVADVAPERACVVRAGGLDLALVCTARGLVAMDNSCPHSGGPLGEGLVQGDTLTCPLHGWQFECSTGRCLTEKRPNQRLYPVRTEREQVLVEVPDVATPPADGDGLVEWIAVAEAAHLRPGTVRKVQAGAQTVALVCTAQGVFAIDNACAHEGGPLAEGTIEGTTVTCPLHGWKYEARTGACLTEARHRQRVFETRITEGKVWVKAAGPAAKATGAGPAKLSPVETWKQARHGIDVWPDVLRHAADRTPMSKIEEPDLQRMKWYGFFFRKNNDNDHYMCRIRIPGCAMSAEQARTVAGIAHQSGYGIVDVTTRGNLQVQGLTIDALPRVLAALERVGLTSRQSGHDNVRNVTSHPWSGLDPDELIDTRELARQIQAMLIGNRELSDLPRKVNVALTGRTDPAAHAWTQDISYVATHGTDGSVGFHLLLGGNQGQSPKLAAHVPVFVRPEQVLGVTGAVLRTYRELGSRHNRHQVRLRYLLERIGPDGMLVEVEKRLGFELERLTTLPKKPSRDETFVGWFRQKQPDAWALGICVPVGRLTADGLDGLAAAARRHGDGTLRTTPDQNLVLPGIPEAAREEAAYAIAAQGLTFEPDAATRNMVACTGKQFCNIAVTETKGYAYQLVEDLRRRRVQLLGVKVHMSGCPSACAMTYTADVGLKGVKIRRGVRVLDAFDVYLGGGLGTEVQMGTLYQKGVPVGELPELVEGLVRDFHLHRGEGETFSAYWRNKLIGHKPAPLSVDRPRWRCTRCDHLHVGEDPPPFCPICAALRARFEPEPEPDELPPVMAAVTAESLRAAAAAEAGAASEPAPWVCASCGLKDFGAEPPELCPVCGAAKTSFQRPERRADAGRAATVRRPSGRRILVVGGSAAGHAAARAARATDPEAHITLVSDEAFYNRLNLTRYLSREVERDQLFDYGPDWYADEQIEILTGMRVIGLDPIQKGVLLAEGRELPYDACVLAHGSSANVPVFHREALPGSFLLRTLGDAEGILARVRPGARAVVVGGGVLGLEAAHGLKTRGASVQVLESSPHLMPCQLDRAAAKLFLDMVGEKGIEAQSGVTVEAILGADQVEGITLADGRRIETDLVVVSTGIRPNVDWVKRSGIRCDRGVVVDDRLQTSAPDVYAAGDVAEWRQQVIGLWTNAIEQAKVAGINAAGGTALFHGFLPVTVLKCLGIDLVSIGEVSEDGGTITSSVVEGPGTYRKVVFRGGIPVGGVLLGTSTGMSELRRLVEGGRELETLRRQVVPDEVVADA